MTINSKRLKFAVTAAVLVGVLGLAGCNGAASNGKNDTKQSAASGKCDVAPDYPKGPLELIVPWAAGGGTDQVARSLANELSKDIGQQVNVVNRTGGGGVVGHQAMADARADGRSLGLVTAEIAMMHWQGLTPLTPADLQPVSQVNSDQAAVTVSKDSKFDSIKTLLKHIKENPGKLKASGTAQGGIAHLAMLGMLMAEGLPTDSVTWVPSDGAAPALQELVAGGVDFIVTSSIGEVRTMLDSGEVKSLAIMAEEHDASYPDVPLLKEAGNDYIGGTWRGISVPLKTDPKIIEELDCYISDIVKRDAFKEIMSAAAFSIQYRSTDEFTKFMKTYDEDMGKVMKEAKLAK